MNLDTKQQPSRSRQLAQRLTPCLLLAIVALGGFLRVYRIDSEGLWLDEAFSVWLGCKPVGQMLGWVARVDQHPPLYYTLLHFWMLILGDGAAAVRALSALLGTLTIPVAYLLGRCLADEKVGLLTALILAISPFHLRFAQEARMYTLLTLNVSLAFYALARLLTDPGSAKLALGRQLVDLWQARGATHPRLSPQPIATDLAWLGYIIFTAATLLSHNTAVFFPLAANLFVLGLLLTRHRHPALRGALQPPSPRNWLLAQASAFLLWAPWLVPFVAQSIDVYREFWLPAPSWATVAGTIGAFLSDSLPVSLGGACLLGTIYAGLTLLGLIHLRRRPTRAVLLLVVFAAPFVGEGLISLRRPIFCGRTLIWASIPLYLLLAAGIRQLHRWPYLLAVTLVVLLAVNGFSLREHYVRSEKEQWDDAARFVAQRVEPEDLILFNATWAQIPFDYYFRRLYNHPVPEHGVPVDLFDRGALEPKMSKSDLPRLRALAGDHERVWLVYSHDWYTDPQRLIPPALGEELDLLDQWDFHGLELWLYGRRCP